MSTILPWVRRCASNSRGRFPGTVRCGWAPLNYRHWRRIEGWRQLHQAVPKRTCGPIEGDSVPTGVILWVKGYTCLPQRQIGGHGLLFEKYDELQSHHSIRVKKVASCWGGVRGIPEQVTPIYGTKTLASV